MMGARPSDFPLNFPLSSGIDRDICVALIQQFRLVGETYAEFDYVDASVPETFRELEFAVSDGRIHSLQMFIDLLAGPTEYGGDQTIVLPFRELDFVFEETLTDVLGRAHAATHARLDTVFDRPYPGETPEGLSTRSWGFVRDALSLWAEATQETSGLLVVDWKLSDE